MGSRSRSGADPTAVELHRLLQIVAHDVRSPLHTMALACDLLETQLADSPAAQRPIAVLRAAIAQANGIVTDVLTLALSPRSGQAQCRARDVVLEVVEQHQNAARLAGVALQPNIPGFEVQANLPRELLLRVLANLLGNAIRHTPPGGTVRIGAASTGGVVTFGVSDTGTGMTHERLGAVLNTAGAPAHGLGIVRSIVEAAGGVISASSRPDQGSTFTVVVPGSAAAGAGRPRHGAEGPRHRREVACEEL